MKTNKQQLISILKLFAVANVLVHGIDISAGSEPQIEDGVLVLNEQNFADQVAKNDYLLVEFYAPWCGHCKELAPEYSKAAQSLAAHNPPYYVAKVDATVNPSLGEKYVTEGYPTLIFFKKGVQMKFTGGRTEKTIVEWYLKKTETSSTLVESCENLKTLVDAQNLAVVFFGDLNSKEFRDAYLTVTENEAVDNKFHFFHMQNNEECGRSFGAAGFPTLALFRKFEESPIFYTPDVTEGWRPALILGWLQAASVPQLFEFGEDFIEPIFTQKRHAIILFRDNDEAKTANYQKAFEEASKSFKGDILFTYSDVEEGMQARLADYLGVENSNLPALRILDPTNQDMKKYIYYGNLKDVTVENIKSFIADFKANKLSPHYKSERAPKDNSKPMKVVVGTTHKEMVVDSESDVFIKYYAPWCGHCQQMAPMWEELANELKDVQGLVLADMDTTSNEVEGLELEGFPTLKLYLKGKKTAPLEFDGDRTPEDLKAYLKEHSTAYQNYLKSKADL